MVCISRFPEMRNFPEASIVRTHKRSTVSSLSGSNRCDSTRDNRHDYVPPDGPPYSITTFTFRSHGVRRGPPGGPASLPQKGREQC